jgi:guanylate kinase
MTPLQLKGRVPPAVAIFKLAPSPQLLEEQSRTRSQESEVVILRRLHDAVEEIRIIRCNFL